MIESIGVDRCAEERLNDTIFIILLLLFEVRQLLFLLLTLTRRCNGLSRLTSISWPISICSLIYPTKYCIDLLLCIIVHRDIALAISCILDRNLIQMVY